VMLGERDRGQKREYLPTCKIETEKGGIMQWNRSFFSVTILRMEMRLLRPLTRIRDDTQCHKVSYPKGSPIISMQNMYHQIEINIFNF
jgi:hypothetical protein